MFNATDVQISDRLPAHLTTRAYTESKGTVMQVMYLWRPIKPPQQPKADLLKFIEECAKSGKLVQTGGWNPQGPSTLITHKKGKVTVTDGPFAETKEVIAGFAIMNVKDKAEGIALGKRFLELAGEGTSEMRELHSRHPDFA
jgi:hypothetical protein